ncbi:ABC transporter permease [candidate division KSB3 bacterium]|uniref:ABC transporter permease n=1 Tax=candidate division KSB3 bacterium TaxID=2044937 RepID=A0A2G6E3A4_9BACT|nr:MAG: ABC transporter permease [candidate division KSB3 bacterium]PIE29068.1 MAG: ABC transporter permease [candidate division KSB3 bacterium]
MSRKSFENILTKGSLSRFLTNNAVPALFLCVSIIAIPLSGFSAQYLAQEMMTRLARNSFLVLSLLIPIIAGMGLNFAMVLGAMAGQIGLIFVTDWNILGVPGIFLAMIISTPLAVLNGFFCGKIMNRARGREMVTGLILGFFSQAIYFLVVLYGMGSIIPMKNRALVLSRGWGIRNAVSLIGVRAALDNWLPLYISWNGEGFPLRLSTVNGDFKIPVMTILMIVLLCVFIAWFKKTKLGQDMRAIGQDIHVAEAAGINVTKTRLIAIILSTLMACYGQIVWLQNMGTINTYNSHEQAGLFSAAALLVGGATVARANIFNVFLGVVLFHLMFVVSPKAGQNLIGSAQLGEFFRVFVSYGVIALSLVIYAWARLKEKERQRMDLQGAKSEP